jgi:ABC-2 type transport system ATP-binding protein
MRTSAIAVSGLRKAYGDKIVLDGIDLDVPAGTVFSLLGPNGAGKTTTVNVLTTLAKADGGTVRVAGHDVATEAKEVRAVIGVTGQFAAVDDLLTGEENLQLMADLHQLPAAEGKRVVASLLERFDLVESAQKMAATYSGGMRRKLDLAMTLVTTPQIIFLDDGTGPAQPSHDVEHHPRAGGRRRDRFPHDPVPRGSRSSRPPDRRARPGPPGCRGHSR